jgi:predicted CXXCH cytochrome family protein
MTRSGRSCLACCLALAASWGLFAAATRAQPAGAITRPGSNPAPASAASGRCGVCHPSERVQFEKSRHAAESVHCTSCHGGDDKSLDTHVAHGGGFRGRPARQQIPALCASCHASEERMRAYNLPVDQYALYQTSGHGRRLAQGDTRVAVCSDCHGAHEILAPSDPASRVFTLNIPKTCGTCHGDSTLMRSRGKPEVLSQYMSSVHAHELFDKGNRRAPTCVSCHGVHGAAPPELGDIDKVCGQCHTAERRYFAAGPHRAALMAAGLPECASCHGDHAIQRALPERLASICADCHGDTGPQRALGNRLWTEYHTASLEVEKAASLIEKADAVPIETEDYRARLEEARTYLREALPAAHNVNEDVVSGLTVRARSVSSEIEHDIVTKLGNLRTRKFVLILFWFYVLLTVLVLRRFRDRSALPE